MKDELYPLSGEDGISVIGVQAGVASAVRLRLKFFSSCCHYLEIHLDRATSLPKMDTGLGTCDAYCLILIGDYHFRTRVVRNSLDPNFRQSFRIAIQVRSYKQPLANLASLQLCSFLPRPRPVACPVVA